MATDSFDIVAGVIRSRRTTKPDKMNGTSVATADLRRLLELADWAPNHGRTEPWRFFVYAGEAVQQFCARHAAMYREHQAPADFQQANFDKLLHMGDKAGAIVIAVMKRGPLPKIPAWEEMAATACAIQNLLLGAAAMNLASYWGSGGMATHPAMKGYLQLAAADEVLGILYLGHTDKLASGTRDIPLSEKVKFMQAADF